MPVGNWNLEFVNHNSQRNYPLADTATGVDTSGTFTLPTDFLCELDLPVNAGMAVNPAGFFLMSVAAYANGYGLTIGYQPADAGLAMPVATALIPAPGFVRNSVFLLGGVGSFFDTIGKVVIGKLDNINAQPSGYWQFTAATTALDVDAVRPILQGVAGLVCVNGAQNSVALYGDVELIAGSNMVITPILGEGQNPAIRFDAISGEGTVQACVCEGDAALTAPITSIQGVAPAPDGSFNIVGSNCVQVTPITNGVLISDSCSQPCCGAAELEAITSTLERFEAQAAAVQQFVNQLQTAVATMELTVLGAKLNDDGCSNCD
jgi:hypothetical protein